MPGADLALLTEAAFEAGRIAKTYFQQDPDTWEKDEDQGPVTAADLAVNDMLLSELRQARPDYGWLSEESEDGLERQDQDRTFIIDPIDGTRAFIEGSNNWTHALAIAHKGEVTAAAVYLPMKDQLYTAEIGSGAWLNGEPLSVSPRQDIKGATVLSNKANMKPEFWPEGVPPVERHFRSSLAYRMSLIGQGRFDAMLTLRDTWEWDIAAGALIVTEAGGQVSTRHGQALKFNGTEPKLPGIVAGGPDIHAALLARL